MNAPGASSSEAVRPVSRRRVQDALRQQGYRFAVRGDGTIGGAWEGDEFTIALVGDTHTVLQVQGSWRRTLDPELAPGIAQVVNDWNRDRVWPKVYTRAYGVGLRVQTEVCVDMTDGATDAQVVEAISCGLGTGAQFFRSLADLVPEAPGSGGLVEP